MAARVSAALGTTSRGLSLSGQLMRLPHTIHPAAKPLALRYYAEKNTRGNELVTVGDGSSSVTLPTASLFVDFCANVMDELEQGRSRSVEVCVMEGTVVDVETHEGYAEVVMAPRGGTSSNGCLGSSGLTDSPDMPDSPETPASSCLTSRFRARAVVVSSSSLGYGVSPVVPAWWSAYLNSAASGASQPDGGSQVGSWDGRHVVVVGGGMAAATRVLEILRSSASSSVTLLTRRRLVVQRYDVDQGWWGTKYMHSYEGLGSAAPRLEACRAARPRGSMRGDVYDMLMGSEWIANGRLCVLQGVDVEVCERVEETARETAREETAGGPHGTPGRLRLRVVRHPGLSKAEAVRSDLGGTSEDARELVCDGVEIACGSAFDVGTHPVLGGVVQREHVEVLGGYPVVEKDCRLHKTSRVFVLGRGAMLAVGPCGGNMVGMRSSAERICGALAGLDAVLDAAHETEVGTSHAKTSTGDTVTGFDPVRRVAVWTSVDGVVLDRSGSGSGSGSTTSSLEFPLEASNALSLLPKSIPTKLENPLDPAALPCKKKVQLSSYAFSDDGFRLSIIMTFPEPISKDRVRIRVTRTALEAWLLGVDTAYHVDVPRLYGNVLPERTVVVAKEAACRVTLKLYKEKDVEWKFLKG